MKKNLLLAMLAAGLLASCSSGLDEVTDPTSPTNPENTNGNDNEQMEIRLGNGGLVSAAVSRAAIAPADWIGTDVGIFGLNKLPNANWTDNSISNGATDNLHCILNGVKAKIVDNATAGATPQGISFVDKTFYYPRVSDKAYSFYGYYPYVAPDNEAMLITTDQVACNYVITGQEDIIWGRAVATPATGTDGKQYDGYNAAFFRKISPAPASPNIAFSHLLTKLTFSLVKGADYKTDNCGVTEIKLTSVPKKGALTIASANVNSSEGTISWTGTTVTNGTVALDPVPADAANITDVPAFKNQVPLVMEGEVKRIDVENSAVMLPANMAKYQLSITINGSPTTLTVNPKSGNFLPGFAYNIALTINGPMEVVMTATLKDWETGEEITTEI